MQSKKKNNGKVYAKAVQAVKKFQSKSKNNKRRWNMEGAAERSDYLMRMAAFMGFLDYLFGEGYAREFREVNPSAFFSQYVDFLMIQKKLAQ